MRPGVTKGTLRRENENSFLWCIMVILNYFSFLVQFLTKLWLLQCLETIGIRKSRLIIE